MNFVPSLYSIVEQHLSEFVLALCQHFRKNLIYYKIVELLIDVSHFDVLTTMLLRNKHGQLPKGNKGRDRVRRSTSWMNQNMIKIQGLLMYFEYFDVNCTLFPTSVTTKIRLNQFYTNRLQNGRTLRLLSWKT